MKAHSNYTTAVTTATWLRHGAAMLLALAALMVALMVLWRTNGESTLPLATSDSFARHVAEPIIPCRVCHDEWLAAQPAPAPIAASTRDTVGRPQHASVPPVSLTHGPIGPCRACRDEWIASQAPIIPSTSGFTFDQPEDPARTSGPR